MAMRYKTTLAIVATLIPTCLAVLLVTITAPRRAVLTAVDSYVTQVWSEYSQPKPPYAVHDMEWIDCRHVRLNVTYYHEDSLENTQPLIASFEHDTWRVEDESFLKTAAPDRISPL